MLFIERASYADLIARAFATPESPYLLLSPRNTPLLLLSSSALYPVALVALFV